MLTVSTTPLQPSPALQRALAGVKLETLKGIVARGLTRGTLLMATQIQAKRLTGKGPFPVSQHKLGVVSGRLRQSIQATEARIEGDSVISSIGTAAAGSSKDKPAASMSFDLIPAVTKILDRYRRL